MNQTLISSKINSKILTGRDESQLELYQGHLLHRDVTSSFQAIQKLAKKEINADLEIISSFRSYARQEIIWNKKASGEREIKNDLGEVLDISSMSKLEILHAIMRFSAIPGASRHHWGTDIDIFDSSKKSKTETQLEPIECGPNGEFFELHNWLDEKILNDESFGFYRPYAEDLGGVCQEKWHISYAPLAKCFFETYDLNMFIQNIETGDILLKDIILEHSKELFDRYISNIS